MHLTRPRPLVFVLKVGAFNGLFATLLSAVAIALISGAANGFPAVVIQALFVVPLLLPITAVSCGSYGFLAGVAAGAWINSRNGRAASMRGVLWRLAVVGVVLSIAFPFFDGALTEALSGANPGPSSLMSLLCVPVGITCALSTAMVFGKRVRL